ncbi:MULTISPECIES: DUF1439 domain-containing protein [Oceanimonas]|uniref:DUF1439 domain-containing protein n=1 Tax=Oceanimonas doudoroffii TaxID=84158 RepID=A0A233REI2_9GAMM|nr:MULTISPECIES: DUF1439 domain-containing protein [Oceanimonas]NHI01314.1 putative lipoprotein YceB [Oceanimonas sp. MB9]OXY81805.1 hypothetical protein B6S08_10130 [Oceanimonas doudoroffii]
MKSILFLILLGVSTALPAQTLSLTEQQLNQHLASQLGREFPVTLGSWLKAAVRLADLQVELGRQQPDKARVSGRGIVTLDQGEQQQDWDISGDFSARPRFDSKEGALYLDEFELLGYRLNNSGAGSQGGLVMPLLLQSLADYLSRYPVYRLSEQDPLRRQLQDQVLSLEISPGRLTLQGLDSLP